MKTSIKNVVVMGTVALLLGFFGTWIAASSIERVGLEMQEVLPHH